MTRNSQRAYDNAKPSYTKVNEKKFADLEAGTTVLIPSPQDIEVVINNLDDDEMLNLSELRARLADMHGADGSCPVMTGMNLRTVADLGIEALDAGVDADEIVPFWKVVEPKSALAKKLPGGPERIRQLRGEE